VRSNIPTNIPTDLSATASSPQTSDCARIIAPKVIGSHGNTAAVVIVIVIFIGSAIAAVAAHRRTSATAVSALAALSLFCRLGRLHARIPHTAGREPVLVLRLHLGRSVGQRGQHEHGPEALAVGEPSQRLALRAGAPRCRRHRRHSVHALQLIEPLAEG
jgi:hypothetical protein